MCFKQLLFRTHKKRFKQTVTHITMIPIEFSMKICFIKEKNKYRSKTTLILCQKHAAQKNPCLNKFNKRVR